MRDFADDTTRIALQLEQLDKRLSAAAETAPLAAANILAESVRSRAPRRSGDLAKSVGAADVGATQQGAGVAKVYVGAFYAWFLEYGTRKMSAKPFFRVGIQAAMKDAIAAMHNAITKADGL